jgi:hypothetical protein
MSTEQNPAAEGVLFGLDAQGRPVTLGDVKKDRSRMSAIVAFSEVGLAAVEAGKSLARDPEFIAQMDLDAINALGPEDFKSMSKEQILAVEKRMCEFAKVRI